MMWRIKTKNVDVEAGRWTWICLVAVIWTAKFRSLGQKAESSRDRSRWLRMISSRRYESLNCMKIQWDREYAVIVLAHRLYAFGLADEEPVRLDSRGSILGWDDASVLSTGDERMCVVLWCEKLVEWPSIMIMIMWCEWIQEVSWSMKTDPKVSSWRVYGSF